MGIWSPLMTKEFLEHALDERRKLSMGLRLPLPVGVGKAAIFHDVEYEECFAALDTFHVLCETLVLGRRRVDVNIATESAWTTSSHKSKQPHTQEARKSGASRQRRDLAYAFLFD